MIIEKSRGFSLIELIVVIAIIGILAAIVMPNYRAYVQRANRSEAQQFMLEIAQRQELYLLDARQYATDISSLNLTAPNTVSSNYTISIKPTSPATPAYFTIVATPKSTGAMSGESTLKYASDGTKEPSDEW